MASNEIETKQSENSVQQPSKTNPQRITHLYLHDRYIKIIPKLCEYQNLSVLYLHNNDINTIENLESFPKLASLYLQKNKILKIKNLSCLRKLRRLYLGHNVLSVVEGLEELNALEELHLEKQYSTEGNPLCFDPRSIIKISATLKILNISHNKIVSISCLAPLKFLTTLNASFNDLDDLDEVCKIVGDWYYLKNVAFLRNPISKLRAYKESVIANTYCLEVLDQKDVSQTTRRFLKSLHKEKVEQNLRRNVNLADKISNLPNNYPVSIQKQVSFSILKESRETGSGDLGIFDEENAVYIPWKTLPKPQRLSKVSLFFKKQRKAKAEETKRNLQQFAHLKL